jgi:hypothetical protein
MSEFTAGALFLKKDTSSIQARLQELNMTHILRSINEKWSAFFIPDQFLQNQETLGQLADVSKAAPILYFMNAEDHFWGYELFADGEEGAMFRFNYELLYGMTLALFQKRYPILEESDLWTNPEQEGTYQTLEREVRGTSQYRETFLQQYAMANLDAFEKIGVAAETREALARVITPEFDGERWDQVEAFKRLLDLEDMSWLNYDIALEEEEELA